jgi:hypothetical protein
MIYKNLFSIFQIIIPAPVTQMKHLILVLAEDPVDRHFDVHTKLINA